MREGIAQIMPGYSVMREYPRREAVNPVKRAGVAT